MSRASLHDPFRSPSAPFAHTPHHTHPCRARRFSISLTSFIRPSHSSVVVPGLCYPPIPQRTPSVILAVQQMPSSLGRVAQIRARIRAWGEGAD